MTALFALALATGLARQENQDAAYAEAAGCSPSPTAWEAIPGMGTTLTALLFSGGRSALVHIGDSRAFQFRSGRLRPITEDQMIGKPRRDVGLLASVLAQHLDGRPDHSADTGLRICGPVAATCCAPAD